MGHKREKKERKKLTMDERKSIVSKIQMNAILSDIWDILKQCGAEEVFNQYITSGGEIDKEIPIPEMGRTLIIKLHETSTPHPVVNFHVEK